MSNESVLIIADNPLGDSSYAVVGKDLANMLKPKYDVYYGGLQYIGKPIQYDGYTLMSFASLQNAYDNLVRMDKKYDHIIYIRNSWAIGTIGDPFRIVRPFSDDIILYTPVEEPKLPKRFFKGLKGFDNDNYYDRLVTMTKTGQKIINKYGIECDYLYHSLNENKLCHKKYEGIDKNVLNISYSMDYRKNIGTYLIMAHNNPEYSFNWAGLSSYYVINDYVELYDIKNFHIINQHKHSTSYNFLSEQNISEMYGQSHYYIQPSLKEGFDLTVLEAVSNGLITYMPNDPIHRELFSDFPNAVFVNGNYDYPGMNQLEYFIPIETWNRYFVAFQDKKRMGIIVKSRFKFENIKEKLYFILRD